MLDKHGTIDFKKRQSILQRQRNRDISCPCKLLFPDEIFPLAFETD